MSLKNKINTNLIVKRPLVNVQFSSLLGFGLLLKVTLCWTFRVFGRRKVRGRSQYLAGGCGH